MARPRVLDDVKKGEIAALVSTGMTMSSVARYVGCDRKTIKRERKVDDAFDYRIRRAEMVVELQPLQAIRRKADTHWRAAAWLLERRDKERAERRARKEAAKNADKVTVSRVDLVKLAGQVKDAVLSAAMFREDEAYLSRKIDQAFVNLVPELAATPGEELPPYEPAGWPYDTALDNTATGDSAASDETRCETAESSEPTAAPPATLPPSAGPVTKPKFIPPRGQTWQQSAANLERSNPQRWGKPAEPASGVNVVEAFHELHAVLRRMLEKRSGTTPQACGEQRDERNSSEKRDASENAELDEQKLAENA